jgi:hypothetical protein
MEPDGGIYFNEAQRKNYERGVAKGKAEGRAQGKAEGKAAGEAAALLKILMQRRLRPTAEQRRRIIECTELAMLERWLDRSLSVASVDELFAVRAKPARNGRPAANGRRKSR